MITAYIARAYHFLANLTYYIPFYYLLAGYLLVWLFALIISRVLLATSNRSTSVEKRAHNAWAAAFFLHLVLFVWFYGNGERLVAAWHGLPWRPFQFQSSFDYMLATLLVLVILIIPVIDISTLWMHLWRGRTQKMTGVATPARIQKA